jgi:hypothetical protein
VFGRDGALIDRPGHHPDERLWLHPDPRLDLRPVLEHPARADVDAARTLLLDELLGDFPWADASDRAHAVAALLLPFARTTHIRRTT